MSTVTTAAPLEPNTAYPRSMSTITADVVSHASAQPPALTAVQSAAARGSSVDCAAPTRPPVMRPASITSARSVPAFVTATEMALPAAIAAAV